MRVSRLQVEDDGAVRAHGPVRMELHGDIQELNERRCSDVCHKFHVFVFLTLHDWIVGLRLIVLLPGHRLELEAIYVRGLVLLGHLRHASSAILLPLLDYLVLAESLDHGVSL